MPVKRTARSLRIVRDPSEEIRLQLVAAFTIEVSASPR